MSKTKIEWATHTENVFVGCSKVSSACDNCYAEKMAKRLQAMKVLGYEGVVDRHGWTGRVNFIPHRLDQLIAGRGKRIFVNSMSDTFHQHVDIDGLYGLACVLENCNHNVFYILTKRPENIPKWWPVADNIFVGVTVENQEQVKRVGTLIEKYPGRKFVSAEPLLGELDLEWPEELWPDGPPMCCDGRECGCKGLPIEPGLIHEIDWVIIGCESLGRSVGRPMRLEWAESLVRQCRDADVPAFVKQIGIDGNIVKDMSRFPESLRVRQIPAIQEIRVRSS